jgi:hypothetical protein
LDSVKDPEVKSADLNVARQFLKDNGLEALAESGSPRGDLVKTLPDFNNAELDISDMNR